MTEEVRRQRHNEAEKRRQKRISDQVNELKDYMTQLGFDVKPGKAAILTATLKHMRELTEQTLRLRQRGGGEGRSSRAPACDCAADRQQGGALSPLQSSSGSGGGVGGSGDGVGGCFEGGSSLAPMDPPGPPLKVRWCTRGESAAASGAVGASAGTAAAGLGALAGLSVPSVTRHPHGEQPGMGRDLVLENLWLAEEALTDPAERVLVEDQRRRLVLDMDILVSRHRAMVQRAIDDKREGKKAKGRSATGQGAQRGASAQATSTSSGGMSGSGSATVGTGKADSSQMQAVQTAMEQMKANQVRSRVCVANMETTYVRPSTFS